MADDTTPRLRDLEQDVRAKAQWARDVEARLTAEVDKQTAQLVTAVEALHADREGTGGAHRLGAPAARRRRASWTSSSTLVRASRWVKLGRKVGLGPAAPQSDMALSETLPPRAAAAAALAVPAGDRLLGAGASRIWLWQLVRRALPAHPDGRAQAGTRRGASVVIPNWNGRDLLEKYLPSVVAALAGNPGERDHRGR